MKCFFVGINSSIESVFLMDKLQMIRMIHLNLPARNTINLRNIDILCTKYVTHTRINAFYNGIMCQFHILFIEDAVKYKMYIFDHL